MAHMSGSAACLRRQHTSPTCRVRAPSTPPPIHRSPPPFRFGSFTCMEIGAEELRINQQSELRSLDARKKGGPKASKVKGSNKNKETVAPDKKNLKVKPKDEEKISADSKEAADDLKIKKMTK
ncbi:hypothetical protein HYPSUDRAFT_1094398 [Hypholoma sublateritium FD-334 SS-4]|uniref:Uncharacterized protein n=1 Tax=Hypholoma sublateritium (strain FD-334 SS-4) TaxID=945553 RepID=A0A0D2KZ51_HYPSF|nr:hypothetical protein HYPSUDRAFT_1094398 [Hypholoma sublateritium FD-334 SS-4]